METAVLKIRSGGAGGISYELAPGGAPIVVAGGPTRESLAAFDRRYRELCSLHSSDGSDTLPRIGPVFRRTVFPGDASTNLVAALRAFARADSLPRLLCISFGVEDGDLLELLLFLPWELLPFVFQTSNLRVARVASKEHVRRAPAREPSLVIEELSIYRGASASSAAEAAELRRRFRSRLHPAVQRGDTLMKRIEEASGIAGGLVLHIASPALRHAALSAEILLSSRRDAPGEWQSVDALAKTLASEARLHFVLLNAPQSGPVAARSLTVSIGAPSVGWLGRVDEDARAAFAMALHRGIFSHCSLAVALGRALQERSSFRAGSLPVLWLSAPGDIDATLERSSVAHLPGDPGDNESGVVSSLPPVTVKVPSVLSPSVFRSNSNAITDLVIDGGSRPALENAESVRVQIECDAGIGKSACTRTVDRLRGPFRVDTEGFRFPVLQELVRQRVDRRDITFTVRLFADEKAVFEDTRATLWLGNAEWLDYKDAWPYLPAYVQPQSGAICDVIDRAEALLAEEKVPGLELIGYPSCGASAAGHEHVRAQMRAIYRALQTRSSGIHYVGPGAAVSAKDGDKLLGGQVVRLADEVWLHGRGTCHDLALILAACAEHVRIAPLLILQTGHTQVGFWADQDCQESFWTSHPTAPSFGSRWLIQDASAFRGLVASGRIVVIEATDVTRPISFEDACRHGEIQSSSRGFDVAVDVLLARREVLSL